MLEKIVELVELANLEKHRINIIEIECHIARNKLNSKLDEIQNLIEGLQMQTGHSNVFVTSGKDWMVVTQNGRSTLVPAHVVEM